MSVTFVTLRCVRYHDWKETALFGAPSEGYHFDSMSRSNRSHKMTYSVSLGRSVQFRQFGHAKWPVRRNHLSANHAKFVAVRCLLQGRLESLTRPGCSKNSLGEEGDTSFATD